MGIAKYVVCDGCEEAEAPYDKIRGGASLKGQYSQIIESGEPAFEEVSHWLVKLKQDPEDPIALMYEYYCPDCKAADEAEDSGDNHRRR